MKRMILLFRLWRAARHLAKCQALVMKALPEGHRDRLYFQRGVIRCVEAINGAQHDGR